MTFNLAVYLFIFINAYKTQGLLSEPNVCSPIVWLRTVCGEIQFKSSFSQLYPLQRPVTLSLSLHLAVN